MTGKGGITVLIIKHDRNIALSDGQKKEQVENRFPGKKCKCVDLRIHAGARYH